MKRTYLTAALTAVGMAVLILDTKTAISGASEGILLCIQTVIPSLFPFFLLSILLTASLTGHRLPFLTPIAGLLRIPAGAESLLAVGLFGGYPVGAQCIAQSCRNGSLSASDGRRMLAFCSNAGPAFLFGIGARLFPSMWLCWLLWGIHIAAAWLVGLMTPGGGAEPVRLPDARPITLPQAMKQSLGIMAVVCGWVILFRTLIAFAQRWFLWLLPEAARLVLCGVLELANGACGLLEEESVGLRFLLFSVFLGFGGLCVTLQTFSVTDHSGVDTALYLPGKITQAAISLLLAAAAQFCFPVQWRWRPGIVPLAVALGICAAYPVVNRRMKKAVAFLHPLVYNDGSLRKP